MSIDIDNPNDYQKDIVLFSYEGGYVYQKIEIHKIEFTDISNLYLLRVANTYVNGNVAYKNNRDDSFKKSEYTEKVYMGIDLSTSYDRLNPIAAWCNKKSSSFNFTSKYSKNIIFSGECDLYDGAAIYKNNDDVKFTYNSNVIDSLFDIDNSKVLRKCDINNYYYATTWEYEMIDRYAKFVTFSINSSYLFEAKPNQSINFMIDTSMDNTNMSIRQKKLFELSI